MRYSQMTACWEALQRPALTTVPGTLATYADDLALEGTPGAILSGGGEPYVLLVIAIDAAGLIALAMIPEALIDAPLRDALKTLDGRTFATAGDLEPAQWDAATLVMSALALEMNSVEDYLAWVSEEQTTHAPNVIESYWNRWTGTGVSAWSQLERPVTAVYGFRRAM